MKNLIVLVIVFAGLMLTTCQNETLIPEAEIPEISSFGDFQQFAGDRLVLAEDQDIEGLTAYLYYNDKGEEPQKFYNVNSNKDYVPELKCWLILIVGTYNVYCDNIPSDMCGYAPNGLVMVCRWEVIPW